MKFKLILLSLTTCLLITTNRSLAQQKLSLEEAVQIALENNYDIKLSSNAVEIAKNDISRGLSTLYPVITGNFSTNNTVSNTSQTLSSGQLQERDGAKNSNTTYGPVLNWKVFDGFEMFARYDQLKEFHKLDESNLKLTIQTTVADVLTNYYALVLQQQQIDASRTALEISRIRFKNSQSRYQIGKAAKLEVLAASVDLNADTTNLLRQVDVYRNTKIRLNELLARELNTDFTVADTIIIQTDLKLADVQTAANEQNPQLQGALISQRIAELNLKQVKGNRYPEINLISGYNFSKSTSELGFAQQSRGRGLNYGLSASINIFSGFIQKKNERNADLEIDNTRLNYEKLSQDISSQIATLYRTYQTNIELVRLEQQNLGVAQQNLEITLEKFKLGSVAPLEFREAQRNYIDANTRFTNAQFVAKLAEINLKQIAGALPLK
ncbi:TolC family protein [Flavihumibacter sp. R14]|nr:TolC family protein [Flavihumibacter soli]